MSTDYITIPLSKQGKNKGQYVTIVDAIDADLNSYRWNVLKKRNTNYAIRKVETANTRTNIHIHRIILARKLDRDELLPHEQVDHINGNGLDNRRENLRLATNAQNAANQRKARNNTSGYKGVIREGKCWIARIGIKGKQIYLGVFDTPELAYKAYCDKAKEVYGEYARLTDV